ncbi:Signal peptidase complex catalytic subunit SEC11C [Tupaia chinensis]|uniref:Signal peptidase complex catalytic subunit SEC11C n=1 Tax=Tupaia chinensis TaxID=246437 RepID=L9LDP5_TUPCH|nr:Signal peptidase complex catalytic subunit SEC11C [Tupaia chinensis]
MFFGVCEAVDAACCKRKSRRAAWVPRDPAMVRAGSVGTHLPASGLDIFGDLRKMNKRQLYYQVLNFAMIVSSALMIWKGLIVLTGSESPIVVVLRDNGDIKFLTKGDNNEVDDRGLYKEGQNWLEKKDVVGRARGPQPCPSTPFSFDNVFILCRGYRNTASGVCLSTLCAHACIPVTRLQTRHCSFIATICSCTLDKCSTVMKRRKSNLSE